MNIEPTLFTFVRHGETIGNRTGTIQGQSESPLNENGQRQAAAAAKALKDATFDVIFASDLGRAAETAQTIRACGHENTPLIFTRQLREWFCGDFEGYRWKDLAEKYPELLMSFTREQKVHPGFPGGEKREEFQARINEFLTKAVAEYAGKNILLVSHGGVLQRIFCFICNAVAEENLLPLAENASISSFRYCPNHNAWQLLSWNRTEHLKKLPLHATIAL